MKHNLKRRTNQAYPSVSMTQKSISYRDTSYLKKGGSKNINKVNIIEKRR